MKSRKAFTIMRGWDTEAKITPRSDADLESDVPGGLTSRYGDWDWDSWLAALEAGDSDAIAEGRAMWGLLLAHE